MLGVGGLTVDNVAVKLGTGRTGLKTDILTVRVRSLCTASPLSQRHAELERYMACAQEAAQQVLRNADSNSDPVLHKKVSFYFLFFPNNPATSSFLELPCG